jgi:hypothetical protein
MAYFEALVKACSEELRNIEKRPEEIYVSEKDLNTMFGFYNKEKVEKKYGNTYKYYYLANRLVYLGRSYEVIFDKRNNARNVIVRGIPLTIDSSYGIVYALMTIMRLN